MPQSQLRKKHAKHLSVGGGRPVVFDGGQYMELHGYWVSDTKEIRVDVPIFEHAYYPKISATDTEVRQNITHRSVTVPSLSTLRANGINADRAVFVAEVVVHPRFIKHRNYFRTDFPASVKTAARRDNVVFIFPANDMPSARFKRKDVLQFWRQAFTPLIIRGRQYTSGRMAYFIAAPADAMKGFHKSLNLEGAHTVDNLKEWHPSLHQERIPRKRGPRPKYTSAQKKLASEIVKETSERMADQLLPMLTDKMELTKGSKADRDLEALMHSPAASQSLLQATSGKKSRLVAVRRWVNDWLMPRLKRIAAEEGEAAMDAVARFAFRAVITVVINTFLGQVKTSRVGQKFDALQRIDYTPDSYASSTTLGAGALRFSFKGSDKTTTESAEAVKVLVNHIIAHDLGLRELSVSQGRVFNINFEPNGRPYKKITITIDKNAWKSLQGKKPNVLGPLNDEDVLRTVEDNLKAYNVTANAEYERRMREGSMHAGDMDLADLLASL